MRKYTLPLPPDDRFSRSRSIEFVRRDLLAIWPLTALRTGEIIEFPMPVLRGDGSCTGELMGPSISTSLSRRVVSTYAMSRAMQREADELAGFETKCAAVWFPVRLAELMRADAAPTTRFDAGEDAEEDAEKDRLADHPFRPEFIVKGTPHGEPVAEGFLGVERPSTVQVSEAVFCLAETLYGSMVEAIMQIGALAAEAWERDLQRCAELDHQLTVAGCSGLLECEEVLELRPVLSVDGEVERAIINDAVWRMSMEAGHAAHFR